MGHALQLALADAVIRMKRMQGFNVLFQPGYDHAGISTQNAVEKHLAKDGRTRQELGREAFEALVWDWLREYGGTIMTQFRRIGASLDYGRERFTLDDGYTRAVMRFFVHLYRKGWIYRASRIIHWCPYHQTSLSDLELVHVDIDDTLSTIRYPLADGSGHIAIATARPATIPADVAVAVHPDDERYRDSRRQAGDRPVRRAPRADHRRRASRARVRYRRAQDHARSRSEGLRDRSRPWPGGADDDRAGRAHERARARARGLPRRRPRTRILDWCRSADLLDSREHYRHSVALCERCESRIEPLISPQWWCSMDELKQPALQALRERRVRYHPESQHRFAIDSLENAPDWCISRQLWWGHQLPLWECPDGHVTVEETAPDACADHAGTEPAYRCRRPAPSPRR